MNDQIFIAVVLATKAALGLLVGWVLLGSARGDHLVPAKYLAFAWQALGIASVATLAAYLMALSGAPSGARFWASIASGVAVGCQVVWLVAGATALSRGREVRGRTLVLGMAAASVLAIATTLLSAADLAEGALRYALRVSLREGVSGIGFVVLAATVFLTYRRRHTAITGAFAASTAAFGLLELTSGLWGTLTPVTGVSSYPRVSSTAELILSIAAGVSMVAWFLESSQQRARAAESLVERQESDLTRARALMESALETVGDAVAVVNRELKIETCNSVFADQYRANSGHDAIGGHALSGLPPERASVWRAHLEDALRGHRSHFVLPINEHSGRRVLEATLTPIRDGEVVSGAVALVRDISDRIVEQHRALASKEHFLGLIQGGSDVIAVLDIEGRFSFLSPAITEVLGWEEGDLLGQTPAAFIHPEDFSETERMAREAFAGSPPRFTASFRFRTKAGEWRTLEGAGRVNRDLDGKKVVVVNARDVTERETLRTQLMQRNKMESIGRLAGGVAHDFNNLLTSILASAEMASEALAKDHPAASDLMEIRTSGLRAAELTKQLLAFARQDVSRPRRLDLNVVVQELYSMLQRLLGERVSLTLDVHPQPVYVNADRSQLEQVIVNLTVNARDAMPDGGRVSIQTSRQGSNRPDEPRCWAMVEVVDSGLGMSDDVRRRIFEPFFTTKASGRGTGLGLAMCYGIITRHGGKIEVVSAIGQGTHMQILLPELALQETGEPGVLPSEAAAASYAGTETLLLVEDDERVRDVTARLLRRWGYRVHEAAEGESALAQLDRLAPDISLVVSDVVMPGMDGPTLAATVRRRFPDLPVILTTGYPGDSLKRQRLEHTDLTVLRKPYESTELLGEVRRLLDETTRPAPVTTPGARSALE